MVVLRGGSDNPLSPENLNVTEKPPADPKENAAFVVRVFNIAEFESSEMQVLLKMEKTSVRKKRSTVDIGLPGLGNATYRVAQRNTDHFGVG